MAHAARVRQPRELATPKFLTKDSYVNDPDNDVDRINRLIRFAIGFALFGGLLFLFGSLTELLTCIILMLFLINCICPLVSSRLAQ